MHDLLLALDERTRMVNGNKYRIGVGAGFAGDRFDAAELLARKGNLDALVFECLAERTIGLAQQRRISGGPGYDSKMIDRIAGTASHLLPSGGVILSNGGAADPRQAATVTLEALSAIKADAVVAAVSGDDVLEQLDYSEARIDGTDETLADLGDRLVSANAYMGMSGIVQALDQGANVVITGRVSDAALFLGPLAQHFHWPSDSWDRLAHGTLVGHLLECAGQLTGGYFADGGSKQVPQLSRLGFPFADVSEDGTAVFGKVDGTGGRLDHRTVLEQLLYEIDDPAAYLTPDVTVDLTGVHIREIGSDRVAVSGARAQGRPEQLKVSVGVRDGYIATASINYGGFNALERAHLAAEIILERWRDVHGFSEPVRTDYVGYNALTPWTQPGRVPSEVQVRFSTRTLRREVARTLSEEVDALYTNGPSGGGGSTGMVKPAIGIVSTKIDRSAVTPVVEVLR